MGSNGIGRRICETKGRYASKREATWKAVVAEKTRGAVLRVYECHYCDGWHLTSETPEEYKAQLARWKERNFS